MKFIVIIVFTTCLLTCCGESTNKFDHLYKITESTPQNTQFGDLLSDLNLQEGELQLFPSRQKASSHFKIEHPSFNHWTIGLKQKFDREKECTTFANSYCLCEKKADNMETCLVTLTIAYNPMTDSMKMFTIAIQIIDENDNRPEFRINGLINNTFHLSFSESDEVGSKRRLPTAIDADSSSFNKMNYHIQNSNYNNVFRLSQSLLNDGLDLVLQKELDRESKSFYDLELVATDSKNSDFTSKLMLRVEVKDMNDCKPEFLYYPENYVSLQISEDIAIGTELINITARDCDIGENGRVAYYIEGKESDSPFEINFTRNMLIVKSKIDREHYSNETEIKIVAKDHGSPVALKETLTLRLYIADINDNSPEIILTEEIHSRQEVDRNHVDAELYKRNKILPHYEVKKLKINAHLKENCETGQIITFITAKDPDFGPNGTVSCYIRNEYVLPTQSSNHSNYNVDLQRFHNLNSYNIAMFDLIEDRSNIIANKDDISRIYRLITREKIDAELLTDVIVEVVCEDLCNTTFDCKRITNRWIRIKITDSNDHPPVISGFSINPDQTDRIYFSKFDKNVRKLEGKDLRNGILAIDVVESVPIGTQLFKVLATDGDVGIYSQISYYFFDSFQEASGPFVISKNTGEVYLNSSLDREALEVYDVTIVISDGSDGFLNKEKVFTSDYKVRIRVIDVNDEKPEIYLVSRENESDVDVLSSPVNNKVVISILENAEINSEIYPKFNIVDKDQGSDLGVSFFLKNDPNENILKNPFDFIKVNNYQQGFALAGKNAFYALVLNDRLDREVRDQFEFRIECIDSDERAVITHTTTLDLTVKILDVNDNRPFISKNTVQSVSIHSVLNQELFEIKGFDPDSGDNGIIVYRILRTTCGNVERDIFQIVNPLRGTVFLKNPIDESFIGDCEMLMELRDNGSEVRLTSVEIIKVRITNEKSDLPQSDSNSTKTTNVISKPSESSEGDLGIFQTTIVTIFSIILICGVFLLLVGFGMTINLCPKRAKLKRKPDSDPSYENYTPRNANDATPTSSFNYTPTFVAMPMDIISSNMHEQIKCLSPTLSHHSFIKERHGGDNNFISNGTPLSVHNKRRSKLYDSYYPYEFDYAANGFTESIHGQLSFQPLKQSLLCASPIVLQKPINDQHMVTHVDGRDSDSGHGQSTDISSNQPQSLDNLNFNQGIAPSLFHKQTTFNSYNMML